MLTLSPKLEACIAENDLKTLRRLLQAIPDKKAKGMAVIMLISSKAPLEKIESFLEAGADVDVKHMCSETEFMPLMVASEISLDYVKLLLRYGANVNAKNDMGQTVLNYACLQGYIHIIDFLLKCGANTGSLTNDGGCVLDSALNAEKKAASTLDFLISKGAPMDNVDEYELTPLLIAAGEGIWN